MFQKLKRSETVDVLLTLAQWVPDYLAFDENRALAVKAIWALGDIDGPAAERALRALSTAESDVVRDNASEQLTRRQSEGR
jgi:hypothetical protein